MIQVANRVAGTQAPRAYWPVVLNWVEELKARVPVD